MRVLLADDSPVTRRVMARMLESWGYEVVLCADGREAWDALTADDPPLLAILDWVMPEMDGVDVCRALREREDEAYRFVFLVSAKNGTEHVLEGLDAGADDYLAKPVSAAELRVRLRNGRRLVEANAALVQAREALRVQASVDALTGVWNRRAFMDMAQEEVARVERAKRPLGLMLLDLDHFKRVNDTFGHRAGDEVLREAAARVRGALREGDALGRYGGEELVVMLPDCAPLSAFAVAERVRRAVCARPVTFEGSVIPVTTSVGVASREPGESLSSLIERADQALYTAKRGGRDRSHLASATPVAEASVA